MEAIFFRTLRGVGFSILLYIGLRWLGVTSIRGQMLAIAPLVVGVAGILVREVYALVIIIFLVGLVNNVFDGYIVEKSAEVYEGVVVSQENIRPKTSEKMDVSRMRSE